MFIYILCSQFWIQLHKCGKIKSNYSFVRALFISNEHFNLIRKKLYDLKFLNAFRQAIDVCAKTVELVRKCVQFAFITM